ncbi:HTH domain-containing protein [Desulfofundulus thermosubterraneus]|uniref:HTH domain-containing protein n=1 Tax=Desulfofundulus thermosubterraneus DSM 16057 TaxID=1121432 RepID=A0A1M6KRF7_9FIRM|nr:HTH domain-containing protein [Desulfofundulus thermosubterraneus]SHJ61525.1 HTH domain-containing protein [Desulfofundulus thermosubterraneus DSM 16057]
MRFSRHDMIFIFALLVAAGTGLATLYNLVIIEMLVSGNTRQVGGAIHYALGLNLAFWGLSVVLGAAGLWFYLRQRQSRDNTGHGHAGEHPAEMVATPCTEQMTELIRTVKETLEVIQPLVLHLTTRQDTASGATTVCDPVFQPGEHLKAGDNRPGEQMGEDESEQEFWPDFPKGLNKVTLKQVLSYLEEHNETGVSSEEIAVGVGLSRVTVRRYMDYLEQIGYVKVELRYGTVGRPLKIYTLVNLFSS